MQHTVGGRGEDFLLVRGEAHADGRHAHEFAGILPSLVPAVSEHAHHAKLRAFEELTKASATDRPRPPDDDSIRSKRLTHAAVTDKPANASPA